MCVSRQAVLPLSSYLDESPPSLRISLGSVTAWLQKKPKSIKVEVRALVSPRYS